MMNKTAQFVKVAVVAVLLICIGLPLAFPGRGWAALVPIADMAYKTDSSLVDNLKALVGKKVNITMASGSSFSGIVKAVGKGLLHLEKLEGKEYFDALIRIEDISAIDSRFREFQR